jgi:hypothetical protein
VGIPAQASKIEIAKIPNHQPRGTPIFAVVILALRRHSESLRVARIGEFWPVGEIGYHVLQNGQRGRPPSSGWLQVPGRFMLGRWVNPTVGTFSGLVLGGYLLIAHPVPSIAPAPPSVVGAPLVFASTQLSFSSYATFTPNPTVAPDDAMPRSTIDLLEAVFGSVLASAWAMIGAWPGARREPARTPINKLARAGTAKTALIADAALRGPTYDGMRCYDEVASKAVGDGGVTRIG